MSSGGKHKRVQEEEDEPSRNAEPAPATSEPPMAVYLHVYEHDEIRALMKPLFAEFIGSMMFVYMSCGAAMSTGAAFVTPGTFQIGIALSTGFAVFVLIFTLGHISGCHINPSVSIALAVTKKISWKRALFYFPAQFLGSILGSLLLVGTFASGYTQTCYGANFLGKGAVAADGFFMEMIITSFMILVVMNSVDKHAGNPILVPFVVGLSWTVCNFVALPITGCSMNPTRSFAASIAASTVKDGSCPRIWDDQWIFWLAPTLGSILGAVAYIYLLQPDDKSLDVILTRGDRRR